MKEISVAIVTFIDRTTQDDNRSKIQVGGMFPNAAIAEDLLPHYPNQEAKRYIIRTSDIERFEEYYNFVQDLVEKHGEQMAIYCLDDGDFTHEEEYRFRTMLDIWNNCDLEHWKSFANGGKSMNYIGKYNVEMIMDIYYDDNGNPYKRVIISEFNGDKEIARKSFFFRTNKKGTGRKYRIPELNTEEQVDELFKRPDNSKLAYTMELKEQ